jgi:hypothetical protein
MDYCQRQRGKAGADSSSVASIQLARWNLPLVRHSSRDFAGEVLKKDGGQKF